MSELNASAPAPARTPAQPAPQPNQAEKKTITLTFDGDDLKVYGHIIKDAEEDERSPSLNLLRFIRKNYGKTSA